MKDKIKKRLAQIRAGKIPEGYKKGKIGIVPDDWEEIIFSELFTSTSEYTDDLEKYPLYSLTIEDGITAKTERYDRSHLVKKENSYKIVRPNDFAYNPMNIRFGAVARHKGEMPVSVSGYYDIFTTVHESDLSFMEGFLTSNSMITYYNRVSTGSLVEKQRVHFSDFMRFSIPLPPLEERKKIAEILTMQDKVIELCERKIEQLKRIKKYYLQNMFPKGGEEYPEIRFKGFTDPWEQRKLSDLIIEYKETVDSECDLPVLTSSKTEGVVLQEEHFGRKQQHDITGYNILPRGYCTYRNRSDGVDFTFNINKCCDKGIISKFYPVFYGNNSDVFFISLVLNHSEEVVHEIGYTCTGTGQKVLSFLDLQKMHITVPSYDEQKKIANYFEQLDSLITLHQRKCEEEKKKKKALQQMLLTGIVRV